jgi:hypothetical protein
MGPNMFLKHETWNKIHQMVSNPEYANLFDNMGKKEDAQEQSQLFDELSEIFVNELMLDENDKDKLRFLLTLGYITGKYSEQNNKMRDKT